MSEVTITTAPPAHLDEVGSLAGLFRKVAAVRGSAPAIRDAGRSLSYQELDEASDRLAATLVAAGVLPGDRVAIFLERSAEAQISVLAVLKAGAAYVPLEPAFPTERLRCLIDDANARVVIGDAENLRARQIEDVKVVSPVTEHGELPHLSQIEIQGDMLAYVMYTSGSTGAPKGCMVTHRNVLELLRGAMSVFAIDARDRVSLFHPVIFDASVFEFWLSMAAGATSVVVPVRTAQSPPDFLAFLDDEEVTLVSQVPTAFRALARSYEEAGRPALALRYVILGGENVELDVISGLLKAYQGPPPSFVNVYGPTETTCVTTCRQLTQADLDGSVRSPIGSALPHAVVEVRGPGMDLVDHGEVGEIMIAGPAVSAGYLGNPQLTAERFVVIDTQAGSTRYYRTGDLARQLPDGSFEYLGRDDGQVKVRGARVELGEVESFLRAHDSVEDAAATVITTASGAQFLVACVVAPACDPANREAILRQHMLDSVPRFLVPDRYLFMPELPLTSSGKLDRRVVKSLATSRRSSVR